MNENPVIILIDEDDNYHIVADLICYNMGLSITAKGKTINEAKEILQRIEAKRLIPDIAIVTSMIEVDINDGRKFAKKLKELVPEVKVIAYTVDDEVDWGDIVAIKSAKDNQDSLIQALNTLTKKEFKFNNLPA